MKKPLCKFAYRTVSWLSDLSGGRRIFVRWKLALATIIIGLSASLTACGPEEGRCYDPATPTCYDPVEVPPPDDSGDKEESSLKITPGARETGADGIFGAADKPSGEFHA